MYVNPPNLAITGVKHLIGAAERPTLKSDGTPGPVLAIGFGSSVKLERLLVTGGIGETAPNYGSGITCGDTTPGSRKLDLLDVVVRQNVWHGLRANGCTLSVSRSVFERNFRYGISAQDAAVTLDRNTFVANGTTSSSFGGAISLDAGISTVTNNIVARNQGVGVYVYADPAPTTVAFNTIVDNVVGMAGQTVNPMISSVHNNIIARNTMANVTCMVSDCSTTGSIILGSDISSLRFVSPDVAPYDYHVMDGSSALGAADPSASVMFDLDGDLRPATGADVGADERP